MIKQAETRQLWRVLWLISTCRLIYSTLVYTRVSAFLSMHELRNLTSKEKLKERLENEKLPRRTLSFYKYHKIESPQKFRDELFTKLSEMNVLGRIYVASEGINAQISVPENRFEDFKKYLYSFPFLENLRLNIALKDDGKSFWKLIIRVKEKIVADGIEDENFSVESAGEYLSAEEFNFLTENDETIVVDMRNYYEYEVGHFENAVEIPADTFREQLPTAAEMLADKKDQPIVMYCTGGIRCEKASAYLKHQGFEKVFHLEGGIIEYVRQVRNKNLQNKFLGKNFVFDERLGEKITDEIISNCHQCGEKCDSHTNCANKGCHILFLQCDECREKFQNCCGEKCAEIINLPEEQQREIRKKMSKKTRPFCNSRKRERPKI